MSSFNTFQVIIIKSHLVNNDVAALTLASFKRSHLVLMALFFCLALSGVFDRCKQPECVTSRNVKLCNKQFDRFVYRVLIQVWLIDKPLSNLIFSRLLCPFIDISGKL